MMTMSYGRPQAGLPPRLQPCPGNLATVRSPGVHGPATPQTGVAYEHYRPHSPRPPRGYSASRLDNLIFNALHNVNNVFSACGLDNSLLYLIFRFPDFFENTKEIQYSPKS